jgi:hypothetical protein
MIFDLLFALRLLCVEGDVQAPYGWSERSYCMDGERCIRGQWIIKRPTCLERRRASRLVLSEDQTVEVGVILGPFRKLKKKTKSGVAK